MQEEKLLSRERKKQEEPTQAHRPLFLFSFFITPFVGSSSTTFYTQMQKTDT
jgi:hypothetical protein